MPQTLNTYVLGARRAWSCYYSKRTPNPDTDRRILFLEILSRGFPGCQTLRRGLPVELPPSLPCDRLNKLRRLSRLLSRMKRLSLL